MNRCDYSCYIAERLWCAGTTAVGVKRHRSRRTITSNAVVICPLVPHNLNPKHSSHDRLSV